MLSLLGLYDPAGGATLPYASPQERNAALLLFVAVFQMLPRGVLTFALENTFGAAAPKPIVGAIEDLLTPFRVVSKDNLAPIVKRLVSSSEVSRASPWSSGGTVDVAVAGDASTIQDAKATCQRALEELLIFACNGSLEGVPHLSAQARVGRAHTRRRGSQAARSRARPARAARRDR